MEINSNQKPSHNVLKSNPAIYMVISSNNIILFYSQLISLMFALVLKHHNHEIIIFHKLGETGLKTGFDVINHLIPNTFKHVDIIEIKQCNFPVDIND